jgi:hypothetical protein
MIGAELGQGQRADHRQNVSIEELAVARGSARLERALAVEPAVGVCPEGDLVGREVRPALGDRDHPAELGFGFLLRAPIGAGLLDTTAVDHSRINP